MPHQLLDLEDRRRHLIAKREKVDCEATLLAQQIPACTEPNTRFIKHGLRLAKLATIERIGRALIRLQAGTYGRCQSCHRPIPTNRLRRIPEAEYCIACDRA